MSKGLLTVEASKVIKELREELGLLTSRIAVVREELAHWEKAVEMHDQRQEHNITSKKASSQSDFVRFAGLSELEVVLQVAKEHNGDIQTKFVTDIFKGKVKNPKNAGPAVFTIIGRLVKQGRAIKVRKGLYHLKDGEKPQTTE